METSGTPLLSQLKAYLRVRWLTFLITTVLSTLAAIVGKVTWTGLWPALILLGLVLAYSLFLQWAISRWLPRYRLGLTWAKWVVPLLDTTVMVALCHATGGVISPYSLLLLLNVLIAALALGPKHAYVGALWATALYGAMILLEARGILPPVQPFGPEQPAWTSGYVEFSSTAASFLLITGLFLMGAAVGGYVTRRLLQQHSEIARLYEATQRETRKLRLLNELSRSLTAILEWPTLLARIFTELGAVFNFDYASLYLYDERADQLRLVGTRGLSDQEAREAEAAAMKGHPGWVVRNRRPFLSTDAEADPGVPSMGDRRSVSVVMVPLLYLERCLGVLGLGSRKRGAFSGEEQELLEGLARQLAVAITNARLYRESRETLEDLRQAQEKLVRSGRLAAVGELLAGLAHELNNPLQIIVGNTQLALEAAGLDSEARLSLETIADAAERIARLVHLLGDLELLREERFEAVDVEALLQEALGLVYGQVEQEGVSVEQDFHHPLPRVWGSRARLLQVLLDLLVNAVDAMRGQERPKRLALRTAVEGGEVIVSVRDSGHGIPTERLAHAFEPGFSTKVEAGRSRALGLGLFLAYYTVRAHGGEVSLISQEDSGTAITIQLPAMPP